MRYFNRSLILIISVVAGTQSAEAAEYRTTNFIVVASSRVTARRIATAAESIRKQHAEDWLGRELPAWDDLCPIVVREGDRYAPSGSTSFIFRNRQPRSWRMSVQGSTDDIVKAVLPHEVMHAVLATHFGRPLPRWADEGICVMVEPPATQAKLLRKVQGKRSAPIAWLFAVDRYPRDILQFYAYGFSVTRFLIETSGRQKFIKFLDDGIRNDDWQTAISRHYGFHDYDQLAANWHKSSLSRQKSTDTDQVVQTSFSER